jgi:hypothetical protein
MNPNKFTYDICRLYLQDHKATLQPEIFDLLMGKTRQRDIDFLASCSSPFSPYIVGRESWATLLQVEAFFKKNKSFSDASRCSHAAELSFERAERMCRITNRRLDYYFVQRERLSPDLDKWISKMESDIYKLLGPTTPFLDKLPELVRVTAGATSTKSRKHALPHLRISKRVVCTAKSVKYLAALSSFWGYGKIKPRLTSVNRVELVPKNWKTDRTIACEPEGNVFLQLAFDEYLKGRLRRVGIDLSDQSRNQELSRVGSIDGSLATIDLSMASDTLAYNTVAWLLPQPWFEYVDAVRTPSGSGLYQGKYAKFSSMGNGTTFPLETLVFTAACRAVGSSKYSVYGDDIIIETELVDDLTTLLRFFGFVINAEKSHVQGPFRESCGANWFEGVDVTPFYMRDIDRRKAVICHLVNGLISCSKPLGRVWEYLRDICISEELPCVPVNDDSMSGVWVSPHHAYDMKLIRNTKRKPWEPKFKAYKPKTSTGVNADIRSLFLWHLDASRVKDRTVFLTRSRYTKTEHKYVRKWVHWIAPVTGVPSSHLYWWSEELLSPRKSGE